MTVTLLKKLQNKLQQEVCNKIELRESADDNIENYNVVHPSCFIGWIPPNQRIGQILKEQQNSIPCVVIGYKKGIDNGECEEIDIELYFVVYSPGQQEENGKMVTNFDGYIDLLNFMDKAKAFLLRDSFTLDFMIINSEIESGMYEEQAYPIWAGFLRFKIRNEAYPNIDKEKYL